MLTYKLTNNWNFTLGHGSIPVAIGSTRDTEQRQQSNLIHTQESVEQLLVDSVWHAYDVDTIIIITSFLAMLTHKPVGWLWSIVELGSIHTFFQTVSTRLFLYSDLLFLVALSQLSQQYYATPKNMSESCGWPAAAWLPTN